MKLRRLAAMVLSAAMVLPAAAAENADARLERVTKSVKTALGIGDEYSSFHGENSELPLGSRWTLRWETDDGSGVRVTATEEGKVIGYNRDAAAVRRDDRFGPSFPAMTREEAQTAARRFLDRVLAKGESAEFDGAQAVPASLGAQQYGFGGTIRLNGLPTPMSFRIWVWISDGMVSSFWRGDESDYAGQPPDAQSSITADKARALLRGVLDMELIYVRDNGGSEAVLRYVPKPADDFYVDAGGKLINLSQLRRELWKDSSAASKSGLAGGGERNAPQAAAEDAADSLSPAEQEGIARLEGILPKQTLDRAVRAWRELKLDGFELAGCHYSVDRQDITHSGADTPQQSGVTARLVYAKRAGDSVARRSVRVDARTGELLEMSGYAPHDSGTAALSAQAARESAEAFLGRLWKDQFAQCELYENAQPDSAGDTYSYTFAQKTNGFFFPENVLTVRICAVDGAVTGFSRSFDESVRFAPAGGEVGLEAAKTAWANSFPVELAYIAVPEKLDLLGGDVRGLLEAGYSCYDTLRPGYALGERDGYYLGVDAKTGRVVRREAEESEDISYGDLSGHWARDAFLELAQYNVGWWGGSAQPDAPLSQLSYIALLASADGYVYRPDSEDGKAADELYAYAVRRGILTRAERDDGRTITRGEMVKLLLDSLGYRDIANLPNIFTCGFTDAGSIPAPMLGYAALAQGLGIVKGDQAGNFDAARPSTRAEAAVTLWQYMKR